MPTYAAVARTKAGDQMAFNASVEMTDQTAIVSVSFSAPWSTCCRGPRERRRHVENGARKRRCRQQHEQQGRNPEDQAPAPNEWTRETFTTGP